MVNPFKRLNPALICQLFLFTLYIFTADTVQSASVAIYPNPSSGIAPLVVELNCVVDLKTSVPASYTINFGDGSEEETVESSNYSHTFTHTYQDGFFKPICDVVKSEMGQVSQSKSRNIIVAKWKFETSGDIDCSPAIGPDGTVYVGSDDGNMYAINPDTGEEIWRFTTGDAIRSSPAIGPNAIYFGSLDNRLYALTLNGALKWALNIDDYIFSSPAISADGSSIYVGASNNNLYKITRSGVIAKTFPTEGKIVSSPVIGNDGIEDVVYIGSLDNHLYALAADNLNLKWKFKADAEIYGSPAVSSTGQIYVGECRTGDSDTYDFKFYSINVDGTKLWEFNGGTGFYSSPAIGPDGIIYVGSWDGRFYALYPGGKVNWSITTNPLADINSSPAVGSNGVIYVGCKNGAFYGLQSSEIEDEDREDWAFLTGDPILDSSPVIDSNGTIYFGSRDNNVYAVNPGNMNLAESSWPMFHKAPDHNGMASDITISDVISTFPVVNSIYVSIDTSQVKINFSPDIDSSRIQIDSFKLEKMITESQNETIEGESFLESNRFSNTAYIATAIFEILNPDEQIEYGTSYLASISYSGDEDLSESEPFETFSWQFTTEPKPQEKDSGSGGSSCFINMIYPELSK